MKKDKFVHLLLGLGFVLLAAPFILLFIQSLQGTVFGGCSSHATQWATTFILPVLGTIIGGAAPTILEGIRDQKGKKGSIPKITAYIVISTLVIYALGLVSTLLIAASQRGIQESESECLAVAGSPLLVLERSEFGLAAWCLFVTTTLGWFFAKAATKDGKETSSETEESKENIEDKEEA